MKEYILSFIKNENRVIRISHVLVLTILLMSQNMLAQKGKLIGLPMQGHTTADMANVLVLAKNSEKLIVKYWKKNGEDTVTKAIQITDTDMVKGFQLNYYKFQLGGLNRNTAYAAHFYIDKIKNKPDAQWRFETTPNEQEIADFSFHLGSCSAPFKGMFVALSPYTKIFNAMNDNESDFMIWMGDNVYYLLKEWNSKEKMIKKNLQYRNNKKISRYLNSRAQYATWDDHDFGPNNSHGDFQNKHKSLALFKKFWANGSWGLEDVPGVFSKFSYSDADFFMLDGRYNRVKDTCMFGQQQMDWLKIELKKSTATFKFIVSGTQMIASGHQEDFEDYPLEKADFMSFLKKEKIKGVIFLNGDVHHAELNKLERKEDYPLYEMTSSALTSPFFPGSLADHPHRIDNTVYLKRNFGKISIQGEVDDRKVVFELFSNKGKLIWRHEVNGKDLR